MDDSLFAKLTILVIDNSSLSRREELKQTVARVPQNKIFRQLFHAQIFEGRDTFMFSSLTCSVGFLTLCSLKKKQFMSESEKHPIFSKICIKRLRRIYKADACLLTLQTRTNDNHTTRHKRL